MASDQWNGFHHAPHPDEDDDWYYDQESDYLADQPPPPPPPPKQSNMLHYQHYAQPAPQPKVRVDLSRVSYSTWQNPWQSSLKYQQSQQSSRPVYGYSAWDYQDEDQDEELAAWKMWLKSIHSTLTHISSIRMKFPLRLNLQVPLRLLRHPLLQLLHLMTWWLFPHLLPFIPANFLLDLRTPKEHPSKTAKRF
ncbi:hypothetical protein IWX50DRAFT_97711 [Phyllosticta citricarpa]